VTAFLLFVPQLVFVPLMQGAMNRRTRERVQIIRRLSISVVETSAGDEARDRADEERIQHVFELNMGVYKFKFSMNFLMNLSTQLQIIGALLVGGLAVYAGRLEIGGVVAFISVNFITQLALEGDIARISYFAVDKSARGEGIGAQMEAYCEQMARSRKCDRIEVHCHLRRKDAHRFYERQGYTDSPKYLIKSLK